ncbi:MAG: PAS domain S-box protein, partial [Geopsychrobacter sp.]|nr:PAS domain S-box protein [Geopsychrobacter sp.]
LEIRYRHQPLADFLEAPITLFVLLLFMIFLADMVQEIIFPQFNFDLTSAQFQLLDAFVTILLIAPLLLILIVRPLRSLALLEKARTNAIYDQVVDGIVKIDDQIHIQSINLAAQKIFGFQSNEVIGKPVSLLLDKGQLNLEKVLNTVEYSDSGEPLKFYDLSSRHKDGRALILNMSITQIRLTGPSEYLLLLHDISERKAAEAALLASDAIFREIYDQTEDAIICFQPGTGTIMDVNLTTEKIYGFSQKELRKQGIAAFCHGDAHKDFANLLQKIEEEGAGRIDVMSNDCKNGVQIKVSLRGKLMSLQGEQVVFLTVRDISERIALETEARELQAKLIQTNKMTSLGLLVSGVAHEINNPNNFVLSNAQLLSKIWNDAQLVLRQYFREHGDFILGGIPFSELETQVPELFHGLTDGSQRINAIVTDLKRFVRQDQAALPTEVDLNAVVTSAVSMLHHELVRYTDNFHLDLADDIPLVKGIPQQLGQVVINLLMNACQALPSKDCPVSLSTVFDRENRQVWINVRDQGSGLPVGLKEKILEPFFSTKLDAGGTGLGLSISMSIIKDHGGELDFYSQPETGTTFTVKLPVEA